MATVPHVTSGLGLRKFQADGFLLTRVYPFNRRLGGPQRRSGRFEERQLFFPYRDSKPGPSSTSPNHHLTSDYVIPATSFILLCMQTLITGLFIPASVLSDSSQPVSIWSHLPPSLSLPIPPSPTLSFPPLPPSEPASLEFFCSLYTINVNLWKLFQNLLISFVFSCQCLCRSLPFNCCYYVTVATVVTSYATKDTNHSTLS